MKSEQRGLWTPLPPRYLSNYYSVAHKITVSGCTIWRGICVSQNNQWLTTVRASWMNCSIMCIMIYELFLGRFLLGFKCEKKLSIMAHHWLRELKNGAIRVFHDIFSSHDDAHVWSYFTFNVKSYQNPKKEGLYLGMRSCEDYITWTFYHSTAKMKQIVNYVLWLFGEVCFFIRHKLRSWIAH